LVKASCKYVDYMAIVGSALGQGIVVLQGQYTFEFRYKITRTFNAFL
jgi:hypothetical protein